MNTKQNAKRIDGKCYLMENMSMKLCDARTNFQLRSTTTNVQNDHKDRLDYAAELWKCDWPSLVFKLREDLNSEELED